MRKTLFGLVGLCGILFALPAMATLPAGYTELEYIESTGTQYIDTGIYGTEKHGLEIKYSYPRLNSSYSGRLCGVRTGAGAANAYAYIGTGSGTLSNSETYYVSSNNGTAWSSSKALDTSIHVASVNILNDNKSYFDGQQIITGLTTPYTHTVKINIFRAYNSSSYAVPTVARVYYCRLTNNGDDVRNFVPAKRNSDNEIGMYDTVSGTFFTNAGTGDFIAGPDAIIKIATTKMVDEEFAAAEAKLAATVQTIESVVSRTISQTEQIAALQAEKQTRPNESCPANKKCLLVEDEQGIPHWYEIIE